MPQWIVDDPTINKTTRQANAKQQKYVLRANSDFFISTKDKMASDKTSIKQINLHYAAEQMGSVLNNTQQHVRKVRKESGKLRNTLTFKIQIMYRWLYNYIGSFGTGN